MKYKPYPAYKDSGVEWLGEVPEGWATHRLRWMFQRKKETNRPEAELLSVYRDYGVIPKSSRDDNFNKPSEDLSAYQFVERGDLVLNKMKTWQGSIAVSDFEGIVSPAYYVARPLKQMNLRFMHYLLRSPVYISQYNLLSAGIRPNQWDLDFDDFRDLVALLPSSQEQTAIAAFLDRETAKIDALIAKQEKLIELLQEKRQALIFHAVTKGLNPDAPMKDSGVAWLGEVPAHWEVKRFKHCLSLTTEKTNRRDRPVALENVEGWSGRFIETASDFEGDGVAFVSGDILFGKLRPYLAKAYLAESAGEAVGDFHVLRPGKSITGRFAQYQILNRDFIAIADSYTFGAKMPRVGWEFMGNMGFLAPPLNEQTAIATFLDRETAKIDALIEKSRRSIELMREHRTALISAAVTGKIDVREAA